MLAQKLPRLRAGLELTIPADLVFQGTYFLQRLSQKAPTPVSGLTSFYLDRHYESYLSNIPNRSAVQEGQLGWFGGQGARSQGEAQRLGRIRMGPWRGW